MRLPEYEALNLDTPDEAGLSWRGRRAYDGAGIGVLELRELTFVHELCAGRPAREAYALAFPKKGRRRISPRLVQQVMERSSIQALLRDRSEQARVDDAYLVLSLKDVAENAANEMARVKALDILADICGIKTRPRQTGEIKITLDLYRPEEES